MMSTHLHSTLSCIAVVASLSIHAQSATTETERYVFWLEDREIGFEDFKSPGDSAIEAKLTPLGIHAVASVGLWWVMDVPKKKRDRGRLLEKVYMAPAFDKSESYMLVRDSFQLKTQILYFDILEVLARHARRQLQAISDSMGHYYGTSWIMCSTIMGDTKEMQKKVYDSYTREVLIERVEGAYEEWRRNIDEALNETVQWATKEEERERFIRQEPILPGYIRSPDILGPMPSREH